MAFDLTETQANYILDMQLRQADAFSTIELEKEAAELSDTIAGLRDIVDDDAVLRRVVGSELARRGQAVRDASPHRAAGLLRRRPRPRPRPLEVADDPCWVLLSGSGLVARTDAQHDLSPDGAGPARRDRLAR